jgi:hypothetical protein
MPAYDAQWFTPPAPLARVTLRHLDTGATVPDVPMLIDSGADVTMLPQRAVSLLGATPIAGTSYELIAFDGSKSTAQAVQLDLLFLKRAFQGRYLLIDQEWGVIGRDILNHLAVLLDGPHLSWEEFVAAKK